MTSRFIAALAATVCLFDPSARAALQTAPTASASAPVLHDLTNARALAARFDSDHGKPRIVLLLSPT